MHDFPMPITALYAGAFAVFLVVISARVSILRLRFQAMFGDAGQEGLIRAIRGQANFIEYVPFALFLMGLVEWQGLKPWVLHTLGGVLIASRFLHYWGLTSRKDLGRIVGAGGTWLVLLAVGLFVLYRGIF